MTNLDLIKELEFVRGMVGSLISLLDELDHTIIADDIENALAHITDYLTMEIELNDHQCNCNQERCPNAKSIHLGFRKPVSGYQERTQGDGQSDSL